MESTIQALDHELAVVYAEPHFVVRAASIDSDDPRRPEQWGLDRVKAPEAWADYPGTFAAVQGNAATGVPIAVVDTGVYAGHPDLNDGRVRTSLGANCVNTQDTCAPGPTDDAFGHGTQVAGVAASAANNGIGIAGLAYNSPIIPVKALSDEAEGTVVAVSNGILWAAEHGAKVVVASFFGRGESQTLCDAVATAVTEYDVIVAAPAGNFGKEEPIFPAACPEAVGVGAVDEANARASYSNWGPHVFISGPGSNVLSTAPLSGPQGDSSGYMRLSGTSMATPHVAATAALIASSRAGSETPASVIVERLAQTAHKIDPYSYDPAAGDVPCSLGRNTVSGYGVVDAARALGAGVRSGTLRLDTAASALEVEPGSAAALALTTNGASETIGFSVSGLPAGAEAQFSPEADSAASVMEVTTQSDTAPGRYELQLTAAANGEGAASVPVFLCVGPSFEVEASPDRQSLIQGSARTFDVETLWRTGAPRDVDFSLTGLPSGATASFAPERTARASTLTISTSPSTPPGSFPVTVKATHPLFVATTSVTLDVQPARSKTLAYTGSTGDVTNDCANGIGSVCFGVEKGDATADIRIDDRIHAGVAARYHVLGPFGVELKAANFCGATQIVLPPEAERIRVALTASNVACRAGSTGSVTAVFR